ncbi:alpha-1,3-galactosidase-related protein [Clostridium nigeriense]|uniref:alpha-1,3-galactosidase-related protein n=1 Tax=Clostridium nigeriense TaxID=1805470 RepID=UPI003D344FA8
MRRIFKKSIIYFIMITVLISNISVSSVKAVEKSDEGIIVNASDYGLDSTGEKDNAKALVNMFENLKELGKNGEHVTLIFDKGIYQINKENAPIREVHTSNTDSVQFPNKSIGILIEDQKNLTIDGNGSEFIINGDMMALAIIQSENITIKDIDIDYQVPTTSEMTVIDYDNDNNTIDYFIPEYLNYEIQGADIIWKSEQKSDGEYYWTERNAHNNYGISIKYPTELMGRSYYSNSNPFTNAQSIEKLDDSRVRIKYNSSPAFEIVKGMNFQLVSNAVRPTAGAFIWESKDINVVDIKISYMHGFGFLVQMAENVSFDGIRMETDIETGRNTSSYADGIHVSGAKGKIEIKNSFFNNTHDDPINIHGTFTRVEEKLDGNKLRLKYVHNQQGGFQQYYPGDKVIFYSRDELSSMDDEKEYTVKSVEGPSKDNLKEMIVEFEEEVPDYLTEKIGNEPKFVAENVTYTPEIYIKNNEFKNVFTRMILATSRKKIVIEDNYFESPSMATLFFSNDSDEWYESGPIRDLEIRNNTFKIRSLGRTWWKYAPAIYFHPVTKGGEFPDQSNPIHKNITIEGNKFYLESDGALRAESVENLTFRNNEIYRLDPSVDLKIEGSDKLYVGNKSNINLTYDGNVVTGLESLPGGPESNSGTVANALEFKNSKNIIVENNYYDDGLRKNVLLEGMDVENLELKDDLKILTNREKTEPSETVSNIQYASTNPEIVSVDGSGKITANKKGIAEVFAYYIWNDTIIESNKQQITVLDQENSLASEFEFESDVIAINGDVGTSFKAKGDINPNEIKYTIHDNETVKLEEDTFYGLKTGLARITAEYKGIEKTVFVIVNGKDDQKVLNDIINIEDKDSNSIVSDDSITITRKPGNDLWGEDNTLNNLVTIDLGNIDTSNFTGTVTIDGLPTRMANNWDSAYFLIMKKNDNGTVDRNNYLSIGKRAHADGFGTVHEIDSTGSEYSTGNTSENSITKATFAIEKQGSVVNLYSIVNENKNKVKSVDISSFGKEVTLAVAGWGSGQTNKNITITDIKLGEGTVDEILLNKPLSIMTNDESNFEISNLEHSVDSNDNITINFDSTHGGSSILIVSEPGNNTYVVNGNTFKANENGEYKVFALSQLPSGKYSNIISTKFNYEVEAKSGFYLNGKKIVDGDILTIPGNLTKLELINYYNNSKSVIDIANKDVVNGEFGTVKLEKINSNTTGIESIEAVGYGDMDLSNENSFINTDKKDNTMTFNIKLSEGTEKILVKNYDHGIDYDVVQDGDSAKVTIPVYNGLISVAFEAIAADGVTKKIHSVHIIRYADIVEGFKNIDVNGESIDISSDKINLENKTNKISVNLEANDINSEVTIIKRNSNGIEELAQGLDVSVDNGDEIILRIIHENKRMMEFKTFIVENSKEPELDIKPLLDLIEEAENIDLTNKTEKSKEKFQEVLDEVKVEVEKGITASDELNKLIDKLQKAMEQLEEKLDIKPLLDLIEEAENIDLTNKTEKSKEKFQEVLDEVKVKVKKGITTSDELNKLIEKLEKSIEDLEDKEEEFNGGSDEGNQDKIDGEVEENKDESSGLPETGDKAGTLGLCILLILSMGSIILIDRKKSKEI